VKVSNYMSYFETAEHAPRPKGGKRAGIIAAGVAGLAIVGGGVALATQSAGASPSPTASYGYAQPGGGPGGTRPTGTAQTPRTPHLVGTVKSASGTTIVITDMDGFTRTINVSSSTTYKNSLTATPATGTKIEAEGTVDADGTSLDATVIETPQQGGPGGGPGGQGGPHGAPKPTGTATTS
jgi:Domain of unknown function (DUF5666)